MRNTDPPLTARSVLASTLLGSDPPELPVSYLVHVASLFGINENRARVALSRMAQHEEVTTDGSGKYRLAGHLLERQARQNASRAGTTRHWNGDWCVVVLTGGARSALQRAGRRAALKRARLGELRDGTWARPANIEVEIRDVDRADLTRVVGRLEVGEGDGRSLAAELFPLSEWARRAAELRSALRRSEPVGAELAEGFVLSAAVLRHLQADPLLPVALLPGDWPGDGLRREYDGWDEKYRAVLAEWSRLPMSDVSSWRPPAG